jgi:hypothetical protein
MIRTQKEAREMWCPRCSRNKIVEKYDTGRTAVYSPETCCIASECMMWCFSDKNEDVGYCGLGGELKDERGEVEDSENS